MSLDINQCTSFNPFENNSSSLEKLSLVRNKGFGWCPSGKGGADHKQDGGAKHMWSLQVLEGVNVTRF
jgi:hypothetical protein